MLSKSLQPKDHYFSGDSFSVDQMTIDSFLPPARSGVSNENMSSPFHHVISNLPLDTTLSPPLCTQSFVFFDKPPPSLTPTYCRSPSPSSPVSLYSTDSLSDHSFGLSLTVTTSKSQLLPNQMEPEQRVSQSSDSRQSINSTQTYHSNSNSNYHCSDTCFEANFENKPAIDKDAEVEDSHVYNGSHHYTDHIYLSEYSPSAYFVNDGLAATSLNPEVVLTQKEDAYTWDDASGGEISRHIAVSIEDPSDVAVDQCLDLHYSPTVWLCENWQNDVGQIKNIDWLSHNNFTDISKPNNTSSLGSDTERENDNQIDQEYTEPTISLRVNRKRRHLRRPSISKKSLKRSSTCLFKPSPAQLDVPLDSRILTVFKHRVESKVPAPFVSSCHLLTKGCENIEESSSCGTPKSVSAKDDRRKSSKRTVEYYGTCFECQQRLGKWIFRTVGANEEKVIIPNQDLTSEERNNYLATPHLILIRVNVKCSECILRKHHPNFDLAENTKNEFEYSNSISFKVDTLHGIIPEPVKMTTRSLPPQSLVGKGKFSPKDKLFVCDVCAGIVGSGSIVSTQPGKDGPSVISFAKSKLAPLFTTEIICAGCTSRYRACTDCGGGGGRLTAGRWRSKELYVDGRRTCSLSHLRNPPLSERAFHVKKLSEISQSAASKLYTECQQLFYNTYLGTLARPEMLERGDGQARTFAQCFRTTSDHWSLIETILSDPNPPSRFQRYIGTQTSAPHKRRASLRSEGNEEILASFSLIEHDIDYGFLFMASNIPWATSGHAFEANEYLTQVIVERIEKDLKELNETRDEKSRYPPITNLWVLLPFLVDSKITNSYTRRGFISLNEYLQTHPRADFRAFPPYREVFLPTEFLTGSNVYVKPMHESQPAPSKSKTRRRKYPNRYI